MARFLKHPLTFILSAFIALGIFYSYALPLYEGNDEGPHYIYVDYLATHRALPDLNNPFGVSHEITQPPLYYAVGATLIGWINRADFASIYSVNPDLVGGIVNDHVLTRELEFPPRGAVLATRLLRLLSLALATIMLALIYAVTLRVFAQKPTAVLATTLMAFNPKFLHMSSQVNNDIAVGLAATFCLWLCVRAAQQKTPVGFRQWLLLGVSVGLATLCKYGGVALFAPVGFTLLFVTFKSNQPTFNLPTLRRCFTQGLFILLGFALTAGWLLLYNTLAYGHPLAWQQVRLANAGLLRTAPLTAWQVWQALPSVIESSWNFFGYGIHFDQRIDNAVMLVFYVAVAGVVFASVHRRVPVLISLLVVAALASFVAFLSWMRTYDETRNARLLSHAFACVAAFTAFGLLSWFPKKLHNWVCATLSGMALLAGIAGGVWLRSAYATPAYLNAEQTKQYEGAAPIQFENGVQLLHAQTDSSRQTPNQPTTLKLVWRTTQPLTKTFRLVIEAVDPQDRVLSRIDTIPFNNRFTTSRWAVGQAFVDDYRVIISPTTQTSTFVTFRVGWYEHRPPYALVKANNGGVNVNVGQVKVRGTPAAQTRLSQPFSATFGSQISLDSFDLNNNTLRLQWRSLGTPNNNYTVFVHALNASGNIIAQSDHPLSPATLFWDSGEVYVDEHTFAGLAQAASIRVGIYEPSNGVRLVAAKPNGELWQDNAAAIR